MPPVLRSVEPFKARTSLRLSGPYFSWPIVGLVPAQGATRLPCPCISYDSLPILLGPHPVLLDAKRLSSVDSKPSVGLLLPFPYTEGRALVVSSRLTYRLQGRLTSHGNTEAQGQRSCSRSHHGVLLPPFSFLSYLSPLSLLSSLCPSLFPSHPSSPHHTSHSSPTVLCGML